MSIKTNLQSAPGPMLGYIFQIERALYWLSLAAAGGSVSIETDDDLVIRLKCDPDIKKLYEQDKSAALSNRNPFSNKSLDLWKTLKIWAAGIAAGSIDLDSTRLLLVTNKNIGSCLIKQIMGMKSSDNDFKAAVLKLKDEGLKSVNTEVKAYAAVVDSLEEAQLLNLFKCLEIMDINYQHDRAGIKAQIRDNLHVSTAIPYNSLYRDLLGWMTDLIISKWLSGEQACIKGAELNTYYTGVITKYASKPFIEKAKDVLPVKDNVRSLQKNENFVRQLDWIELDEKDKINAIDDFIRARWERARFAREGNIPCKKDFQQMDDELHERWEHLQRPVARHCKSDLDKKEKGYDLYWSVMNHKAKLASYDTEQFYTTKGAYHILANQFRLGWHFNWEILKESTDGEN